MTIEQTIKNAVQESLDSGIVEQKVKESFENQVGDAVKDLFRNYGDINSIIKNKLKDTMIPLIKEHDFNDYIPKLDALLTQMVNGLTKEPAKLVENFQQLTQPEQVNEVSLSDIIHTYAEYAGDHVDTDDLEVLTDDSVHYEDVTMKINIDYEENYYYADYAKIDLHIEQDSKLDTSIHLVRHTWKGEKEPWQIATSPISSNTLTSLSNMHAYELKLLRCYQARTSIIIDIDDGDDWDVEVTQEPEATFI